jgi:negative regulator of flagellin synthesis FlgM
MPIEITGQSLVQSSSNRDTPQVQVGRQQATAAQQQTGQPSTQDTVSLSDAVNVLKKLESVLAKLPVIDSQRVEDVKKSLSTGSFEFNPVRTAGKFLHMARAINRLYSAS